MVQQVRSHRLEGRVCSTVGRLPSGYGRMFGLDCLRSVGGERVTSTVNISLHAVRTRVCGTLGCLHKHLSRLVFLFVLFFLEWMDIFVS